MRASGGGGEEKATVGGWAHAERKHSIPASAHRASFMSAAIRPAKRVFFLANVFQVVSFASPGNDSSP